MAATYTLAQTTVKTPMGADENYVYLDSVTNVRPGLILVVTSGSAGLEAMDVLEYSTSSGWAKVTRGAFGTSGKRHSSGDQVFIATPDQVYDVDPSGDPIESVYVQPWINLSNGKVWFPYGDEVPEGLTQRWWREQTTAHDFGALGVRTTTIVGVQT